MVAIYGLSAGAEIFFALSMAIIRLPLYVFGLAMMGRFRHLSYYLKRRRLIKL